MKVVVADTRSGRSLSFDGSTISGDPAAQRELERLLSLRAPLMRPNPHDRPVVASLSDSPDTLLITLRHAVSASPYAGFVTVTVEDDTTTPSRQAGQAGNVSLSGVEGSRSRKDLTVLLCRVPLTPDVVEYKSGLFSSGSRFTQEIEAAVSLAVPGDMSPVRSPVRSAIYRAVTPGGGGGRRRIGGPRNVRCPAGFEYGGRFASRNLANCGRRLFVAAAENLLDAAGGQGRNGRDRIDPFGMDLVGTIEGDSQVIGGARFRGRAAQIIRNAEIPPVGRRNDNALFGAIRRSADMLDDPGGSDDIRLVRRDGVVLRPAVPVSTLARSTSSPDMDGGVFVSRRNDPTKIGDVEIPALLRSPLRGVAFAIPGGGTITMEKRRPLTTGDKRRLSRVWATSQQIDNYDFAAPMRRLSEQSNGAITYREDFPSRDADDLVGITNGKRTTSVRRWVYDAFLADKAPANIGETWRLTDARPTTRRADSTIGTIAEAVTFLNGGGAPRDVPPSLLGEALPRARAFKRFSVSTNVKAYRRGNSTFYATRSRSDFEHLAHRVSAEVQEQVGLDAPDVVFMGAPGRRRDSLIEFPAGQLDESATFADVNPSDLLRLVMADFLTDQRDRSELSIVQFRRGGRNRLVASENGASVLAGVTPARRSYRQRMGVDEYFNEQRNKGFLDRFSNLTDRQKQILLGTYDDVRKRAQRWSVEEFIEMLTVDGELSDAERTHLEAMRVLYGRRVGQLGNREAFLSAVGVQD